MTYISPLNQNLINKVNPSLISANSLNMTMTADNKADKHEKVYQNLIVESNTVKPNKAKAALIRDKFPRNAINTVKDFIQDGKNFFKAAKTGKMDDNSLGRINDFGMKTGGLLIATFLAAHARTKTSAIMQYIGGAAFFANMALWPKLFINLPAKLVHGFKIDQRYISAQGEKKDFFLDNQFLPWDAFEESELRENARRAGIDYDSENGDEKIKRKMQKTALQNRTLWMATAGFATPLMTALFGDFIEPKVKNAVVNHGVKKSQKNIQNVDKVLGNSKSIVRHSEEINEVISKFKAGKINADEMIKGLSANLSLDLSEVFNDVDDIKPVKNLKFSVDAETLKQIRRETSAIDEKNLPTLLKKAFVQNKTKGNDVVDSITQLFSDVEVKEETKGLSVQVVDSIIEDFSKSGDKTYKQLQKIIADKSGLSEKEISRKLSSISKKFKYDDTKFFEIVKEYNTNVLGNVRGRLKAYLGDILNPVLGSKDESAYTNMYRNAMKKALPKRGKLLGFLPIYDKQTIEALKAIETPHMNLADSKDVSKGMQYYASEASAKALAPLAEIADPQKYKAALQKLFVSKDGEISEFSKLVTDDANLAKITSLGSSQHKGTFDRMTADLSKSIGDNIKQFVEIANINNDAIRAKALIGANLERRIKDTELGFKKELTDAGLISKEFPYEEWVKKARYMVYQGTVASDACMLEFKNENLYMKLREIIYNSSKFTTEKEVMPEMEHVLKGLRELKTGVKDNAYAAGLANLEKTVATEILNNQSWKKIFWPMSLALVAVTLLAQPFFGNIKKEFPDEIPNNKGGKN